MAEQSTETSSKVSKSSHEVISFLSAAVLAKSNQHSDLIHDDKLARIVTSTYRILDPRGRHLFAQRIQLLHFESPPADVPRWWEPKTTHLKKVGSAKDRFDPNVADEAYVPGILESPQPWDAVTERLGLAPVSRRAASIAGSSFAFLFVLSVVVVSLRSSPEKDAAKSPGQGRVVAEASEPVPDVPKTTAPFVETPVPESAISAQTAPGGDTSPAESATPEPSPSANPQFSSNAMGVAKQREASDKHEIDAAGESSRKANSELADSGIPELTDTQGSLHAETTSAMIAAGAASGASQHEIAETSDQLPKKIDNLIPKAEEVVVDPVEQLSPSSVEEPDENLSTPLESVLSPAMDPLTQTDDDATKPDATKPEAGKVEDARHPIPGQEALATAAERMQRLLVDLPDAGADLGSIADIRAIRETILQCEPGSEDRWVLMQEALQRLVLVGREAAALRAIDELVGEYETDELSVRNAVLQGISSAGTIVQKERVLRWALQTSEQAILSEDFEFAADATRSATTIAVQLGDSELRSRTSSQTDTIRQAKRMATTANDVVNNSTLHDASASEANSVGRYLCLYRRDWQQGLPWLTRVSSPKIAQTAQRELDREDVDALALVDEWFDVASDERGRTAESILLHCRDLASGELEISAGLKTKDIQRRIEDIDAKLPADLRLPATDTDDELPVAPTLNRLTGMLGRIKADGLDVGALVRYEPGLGLTRQALSQILDQLGVKAGVVSAEFVGLIDLKENSTIRFVAGGATQPGDLVAVTASDQTVALRENAPKDRHAGEIDLPAGTHLVRWQFGGAQLDTCHLFIEDARDKKAVLIRHTPALIRQVVGLSAPQLRVNVVNAR